MKKVKPAPPRRMHVYGYTRVSSEDQAESGLSLEDQTATIRLRAAAIAAQYSLAVGEVLADAAVSATRYELRLRPAGNRLDGLLDRGDHVVFAKLDRAFRNQRDCVNTMHAWESRGIIVHLLDLGVDTATPSGKLVVGIMAAFAQWESSRIGERIHEAKRAMWARGVTVNGMRVIGWKIGRGGRLIANEAERKIARRIKRMRDRGMFWREISQKLTKDKVSRPRTYRSQKLRGWTPQACCRLYERLAAGWPRNNVASKHTR